MSWVFLQCILDNGTFPLIVNCEIAVVCMCLCTLWEVVPQIWLLLY